MASRPPGPLRTPPGQSSEVRIAGRMPEIARVADLVEAFSTAHRLPKEVAFALSVSLDEVLNNVISYAYDDPSGHEIVVRLTLRRDKVEALVQDKGRPFNPLSPTAQGGPSDDRIGGVGLRFVRALTDEARYARRNGVNQLRLIKNARTKRERATGHEPGRDCR